MSLELEELLNLISSFWCDLAGLEDALVKRVMITPEEVIKRSLDPQSTAISRDGLAKTIYSRLFDWLVDKINNLIGQDATFKFFIGVLDIYGFGSFKTKINSWNSSIHCSGGSVTKGVRRKDCRCLVLWCDPLCHVSWCIPF